MTCPLLFLHPHNHAFPHELPVGAIAAMNLLPVPKLGRFAHEVSRDELREARVVLLDLHWFLPLGVLDEVLRAVRAANPSAAIVAGGITASFYAELLLARHDLDFVVAGHVERSLPRLVERLLAGEPVPPIAGVHRRGQDAAPAALPAPEDLDALDYLTIDWFPSYERRVHEIHARHPLGLDAHPYANTYFPHLIVTRGCHRACHHCAGSHQGRVFGPRVLRRSPEALLRDLERIEEDPRLAFATLVFADAAYLPPYADLLADRDLDLDAFVFFCGSVPPPVLDALRSGFRGAVDCSIVQPADLGGWDRATAQERARAQEAFRETLAHLRTLDGTRSVVFHIEQPLPEHLLPRADERMRAESGAEWCIRRPDQTALADEGDAARQLDDVTAAARQARTGFLLRALVPTLRQIPVVTAGVDAAISAGLDAFEARLVKLAEEEIRRTGAYGFSGLELTCTLREETSGGGAGPRWASPGEAAPASLTWFATARGYGLEGTVEVGSDRPQALGLVPVVELWDGSRVSVAEWPRALVATLTVAPGPARTVTLRGRTEGERVHVTIDEGPGEEAGPPGDAGPREEAGPRGRARWLEPPRRDSERG